MKREQVQKAKVVTREPEPEQVVTAADKAALKADLDALLDEVDGVLEENAETFVAQYVQKGGE